ncbi:transglycosylase domain-containing protein [Arthrobacter glacialis]|uniref:transglycosylase domain-containing protein n=1 Tax=Arthrobacter glacialis TaxID=1664 RepID=UPI0027960F15|nr:transglycosylase domain-containing protein [Arthrobacter glacialis]
MTFDGPPVRKPAGVPAEREAVVAIGPRFLILVLAAVVATLQGGREGASTITQQYVNNVIIQNLVSKGDASQVKLGAQKTVADKLKEMRLAIAMEKGTPKTRSARAT